MSNGNGRVYRRGSVWWIDYSHNGQRFRESSGSDRKKDARELLRKRLGEIGHGRFIGPDATRVTLDDLLLGIERDYEVNERKSIRRLRSSLKHLRSFFGRRERAVSITTPRIRRYILHRRADGAANSTIRKELAALRRAFRLSVQAGTLGTAPHIPGIEVSNTREGFVTAEDLQAILAELPEYLRGPTEFAWFTGWRKGEVLGLRWAQVDWESGVIRLAAGSTKNREARELVFEALPHLHELLKRQKACTREVEARQQRIVQHVFHRDGEQIRSLRTAWKRACEDAGQPGVWFHDLRRSAVMNLERAGVSRSVAMKVTGHKTESVYRRYAIVDRAAQEEGLAKLAKLHGTIGS